MNDLEQREPDDRPGVAASSNIRLSPGEVAPIPAVIASAIVKIQAEVAPLEKSAENPHFKNTYVPLSEVMREALKLMSKYRLGISQWPVSRDEKTFLITILMHESGASIQGEQELLLARRDSQGQGSSMTYARRYGIMAILGLVGDDDDDGNRASGRQTKPTADQISEIRQLCIDLKFPPDQVQTRLVSVRTEDQASVVLDSLRKMISQRAAALKDEAKAIPVFTGDRDQVVPPQVIDDAAQTDAVIANIQKHILSLPITSKAKRALVRHVTGKPFLANCSPEEITAVAEVIDGIKGGTYEVPASWTENDIAPPEEAA